MSRLRNRKSTKFTSLAHQFHIPKSHGKDPKKWVCDYINEVKFFMDFITLLTDNGAQLSSCGNFVTSNTGAFYTKAVLFKNKEDKQSDKLICEDPVWGKRGTTPSKAARDLRRFIRTRETLNFKISTNNFKIKHCVYPVSALFCEQNVHYEKGELISHAYSVILKRNLSSQGKKEGFAVIQKDSLRQTKEYAYFDKFSRKIKPRNSKALGLDYQNNNISVKDECLTQAYFDCARGMDGAF